MKSLASLELEACRIKRRTQLKLVNNTILREDRTGLVGLRDRLMLRIC